MREGCQQAADLGGGHGDEVTYVVAAMVIMPQACRESCPQPLVPPLSGTQAAEALGISRSTFNRRVLPYVDSVDTPWGTRLIPVDELERLLAEFRHRLIVESADDRTELDLAADARLFPPEPGRPAPTLSGEELAVDKVLAVSGRAEARDFTDLMAVEPRCGLDRLFQLALEKDRGFTPAVFADMLGQFRRLRRDEFEVDDERYDELVQHVERWREHALKRVRRPERGLDR